MEKMELPLLRGNDREKCIPVTVIIGLVLMLIILSLTFFSLTIKGTYKLHYTDSSNMDYRLYLKDNDFYSENIFSKSDVDGEKISFISSLIDKIDTDFNYTFRSDAKIALEYSYYIEAKVQVLTPDGNQVYKRVENLVENNKFSSIDDNLFKINETVTIDYDKYKNIASDYMKEYLPAGEAKLTVGLYVKLNGKHADFEKSFTDSAVSLLTVPLSTNTASLDLKYDSSKSKDQVLQYKSTIINNPVLFGLSIALAIVDAIAIALVLAWIIKNRDNKTVYRKKLERILKDYERYISETVITERVEDMMKTRSLRIEVIKTFEGLVDIRDNLGKPILFHEERPGEEAVFYIITDRTGYIYVMRAEDLRKDKSGKRSFINDKMYDELNSKKAKRRKALNK